MTGGKGARAAACGRGPAATLPVEQLLAATVFAGACAANEINANCSIITI